MISVYDYTDYRRFLKDRFVDLKKRNPLFSYRSFNRLAGIQSSGFLKLVIDGKRNLAAEGIAKIVQGFRLSEAERNYFEVLVKFNQARNHEEKDRYFHEISQNKKFIAAKPLTHAQYRLFSHWYYVAILELVRAETKSAKDIRWLQRCLNPEVGLKDLKIAVRELKKLKLLEEKHGNLIRHEAMFTTSDEVNSISVANFHVQMCQMAARAVMQEDPSEREFSTLTVITSEESFRKAKHEIQKFRKRLHSLLEQENDRPKTFVGHINLQLFKLSKRDELS